ncbi:MAG: TolB family protein [Phycisphaerales bacterium]
MRAPTLYLAGSLLLAACNISPVRSRVKVGEEAYLVFVAEGSDQRTDLFVVPASGGNTARLTFTPVVERSPTLTSRGDMLAFLRIAADSTAGPRGVVVMNMLNGAERLIELPDRAGAITQVAWRDDDAALWLRTATGLWTVNAPPAAADARLVTGSEAALADSALGLWVGSPRFARVVACANGGICVVPPSGDTAQVSPTGRDPARWGSDSLAWFEGEELFVRSLGRGTPRRVPLRMVNTDPPRHPREVAHAGS